MTDVGNCQRKGSNAIEEIEDKITRCLAWKAVRSDIAFANDMSIMSNKRRLMISRRRRSARNMASMHKFALHRKDLIKLKIQNDRQVAVTGGDLCPICLTTMEHTPSFSTPWQHCYTLPCGHLFHSYCIRQWFQKKSVCPIDRSPFPGLQIR